MKKILMICIFLILPLISLAAEKPVWVESVGEALLGEIETPKEVKERAKIDAQNNRIWGTLIQMQLSNFFPASETGRAGDVPEIK